MRQRAVLKDDRGMSFEEIGEELGVSWQRAAAICAQAMTKVKVELARRGYDGESFLDIEERCSSDLPESGR